MILLQETVQIFQGFGPFFKGVRPKAPLVLKFLNPLRVHRRVFWHFETKTLLLLAVSLEKFLNLPFAAALIIILQK